MGQITIGENRVNQKLVHLDSIVFFFEGGTCTARIYIHKMGRQSGASLEFTVGSEHFGNQRNIQENPSSSTNLSL